LEKPIFLELFSKRKFHHLLKFLHFIDNKSYYEATCSSKRLYKLEPILDLNAKFRSVHTPECDVSVDESLMMWKGHLSWKVYIPSKHTRFVYSHLNFVKINLVMYGILLFTMRHLQCHNKPSWECVFLLDSFVSQLP
jgi:hypothetical protein